MRVVALLATLACVAIFVVRAERALVEQSQTFDEAVHLTAGYSYWRTGDFRINRETPPLAKLLWALPLSVTDRPPFQPDAGQWEQNDIWRMSDAFLYESAVDHREMLNQARRVNVAMGAMLVGLVGWWAYRWSGMWAGVAASAFAAIDPNWLGQCIVLSTDAPLTLFAVGSAYAMWEYAANQRRGWFLLGAVCLGLALATKYSAVVLAAAGGCGLIAFVLAGGSVTLPGVAAAASRRERLLQLLPVFVRLGLIAFVVIVPSYFFVQALDWPKGFRQQLGRNEFAPPKYFLNGEISTSGWWHYFVIALAIKTPVGALAAAAVGSVRRWPRRDLLMVIPPLAFFAAMSLARLDIGLRVVLPAYALLWLLAARLADFGATNWSRRLGQGAVAIAAVVTAGWDASDAHRPLSYFNAVVGRGQGHAWLGDSNVDWGQGLVALERELSTHASDVIYLSYAGTARPEAYGVRHERLPGWGGFRPPTGDRVDPDRRVLVAVSVSNLQGTYLDDPTLYHWLRDRTPISRCDGSIWLFDVTNDPDARARLRALATE